MNMQLIIGFLLAIIIAYLAYRARSLDRSGAYAAFVVGTVIFGLGGWGWAILLLTFFITSSGLSRAFKERKREANEKYAKGGQRDAGQVFGNGGIATLFAAVAHFLPRSDLALAGIRGLAGGGQCRYLGYGIGRAQSDFAEIDHRPAQSRRKGNIRRGLAGRDAGLAGRGRDYWLVSCFAFSNRN